MEVRFNKNPDIAVKMHMETIVTLNLGRVFIHHPIQGPVNLGLQPAAAGRKLWCRHSEPDESKE